MSSLLLLSIFSVFIFVCLLISIFFNVKHGVLILKMQDSIEYSLDILDKKYESMSKVLDMPIFFDSVEVRKVVSDIKDSRDAILIVARDLAGSLDEDIEKEESDGN